MPPQAMREEPSSEAIVLDFDVRVKYMEVAAMSDPLHEALNLREKIADV